MDFNVAAKSSSFRAPDFTPAVSQERIDEFIQGIYGQNRKSNSLAAKRALKAVLFGVAAEVAAASRRRRG